MAKVYFVKNINAKSVTKLLDAAGISEIVQSNEFCAVKMHFGEKGNKGYIKKELVKPIVEKIKSLNAVPFLTDTNSMYVGERTDAIRHLKIAKEHGFSLEDIGCPVIIAGGIRGNAKVDVEINKKHFKKVSIAHDIYYSDSILFLTHFKGHVFAATGGVIKNISMGCSSRSGKFEMHNSVSPNVNMQNCKGCGICVKWCPPGALVLETTRSKRLMIKFNKEKCIGCGECILSCKNKVFTIPWNERMETFQEKMVEYVYGITRNKRYLCINFLNFITKNCDCMATHDGPLVDDVGILASTDPVAIDQASIDLINKKFGSDFFRHIYPNIDYTPQLAYAEQLGIGSRKYDLQEI